MSKNGLADTPGGLVPSCRFRLGRHRLFGCSSARQLPIGCHFRSCIANHLLLFPRPSSLGGDHLVTQHWMSQIPSEDRVVRVVVVDLTALHCCVTDATARCPSTMSEATTDASPRCHVMEMPRVVLKAVTLCCRWKLTRSLDHWNRRELLLA